MNELIYDVKDLVGKTITNVITDKYKTVIGIETQDEKVLILIPEEESDCCGDHQYDYIDDDSYIDDLTMDQKYELKLISEEEYNKWAEEVRRKKEEKERKIQKEKEEREKIKKQEEIQELHRLAQKYGKTIN